MPLPSGLSLSSAGAIVGRPVAGAAVGGEATDYTFTVQGIDANGRVARAKHTITVNPAVTLTLSYPAGQVGVAYSGTATSTGGAAPKAYTVASGALPTSVSLNASTGALSGTPSAAGTFTGTIRVTSDLGSTTTAAFSIVIAAA
jgi:hypothetical protein